MPRASLPSVKRRIAARGDRMDCAGGRSEMAMSRKGFRLISLIAPIALIAFNLEAQLAPETASRVDAITAKAMEETAVPSISLAVVKDGKIAYVHAYGNASLDPATPARP